MYCFSAAAAAAAARCTTCAVTVQHDIGYLTVFRADLMADILLVIGRPNLESARSENGNTMPRHPKCPFAQPLSLVPA